jgi:hypothetical protein
MNIFLKSFTLGTTGAIALIFSFVFSQIPSSIKKSSTINNLYARVFPLYFGCMNVILVYFYQYFSVYQNQKKIAILILIMGILSTTIIFLIAYTQQFYNLYFKGWLFYYITVFFLQLFVFTLLIYINKSFNIIK